MNDASAPPALHHLPPEQVTLRLVEVEKTVSEHRKETGEKFATVAKSILDVTDLVQEVRREMGEFSDQLESNARTLVNGVLRLGARMGRAEVKLQELGRVVLGNAEKLPEEKQGELRDLRDRLAAQSLRTKAAEQNAARARQDSAHAIEEAREAKGDAKQAKEYVLHLTKKQAGAASVGITVLGASLPYLPEAMKWLTHFFNL